VTADVPTLSAPVDALGETVHRGEPDASGELFRGDSVGRFVVLGRLGQGGMGVVYAAFDPDLDRKIALKLVLPERGGGAQARARMLREAQAMARLAHPNVVAVHDVGAVGERIWIAMEYVGGQTLGRWLAERRRTWGQIVDVFVQAGEGLRAAHAVGLVHRDFKPDNVMIGDDGRTRVMDFGLACAGVAEVAEGSGQRANDPLVTQAGAAVGTPRYMAPEQWQGRVADAQADQFAFCVALWEALYGQPPFAGDSVPALVHSVLAGDIRTPTNGGATPGWLRRTLRRGLAVALAQRWPSMEALLAALDRRPRQRRLAAAAALLAVLAGGSAFASRGGADACAAAGAPMARVWHAERGTAIEAAFDATGLVYARGTWTRVAADLDAYARAWTVAATDACRGDESSAQELVQLCLERRRVEFGALTEVLATATPEVVENARQAVLRLTPPSACRDTRLAEIEASLPLPEDPLTVGALRERLSRVAAEDSAGRYDAALAGAVALQAEAEELQYLPLIAEVGLRRGTILAHMYKFAAADEALVGALAAAEGADHDLARAEAMVARIDVAGVRLAQHELMRAWIPMTQGLVLRVAPDTPLAALMWTHAGRVASAGFRLDEAEALHRRALTVLEQGAADDDPARITVLLNLSIALHGLERRDEGLAALAEAEALTRSVLGPEHPSLIFIYNSLGNTQIDPARAPEYYEKSRTLSERLFGPRSPGVAAALANIAEVQMLDGDVAIARDNYAKAADIIADSYDVSHPKRAEYLIGLAEAQAKSGEIAEARDSYARAEAIFAAHPWTPDAALAISGLAATYALERRWEEARAQYSRANEVMASRTPETPHFYTEGLRGEATALLELGRPAEAAAVARRITDTPKKFHRRGVGKTRFVLAQALYALGERTAAFAEAEVALNELTGEHFDAGATMADIEMWLASVRTAEDPPRPPRVLR
jgi:tetratricopeptide (TPR) repeat protein